MLCSLHVPPEKPQIIEWAKTLGLMALLLIILFAAMHFGFVYYRARTFVLV